MPALSRRFETALDIQNACNPSGVAKTFYDLACEFMRSPEFTGTNAVRNDPALKLIAFKLADLMGVGTLDGTEAFWKAHDECVAKRDATRQESTND